MTAPLKVVGNGDGSSRATGTVTVRATKSEYSDNIDLQTTVDESKVQDVTKDQAQSQANNPLGKAYITDDGVVIIMRVPGQTQDKGTMGEYIYIHLKRVSN